MMIWVPANMIYTFKKIITMRNEKFKDTIFTIKCEKCGNEKQIGMKDINYFGFHKSKSTTVSANIGLVGASYTKYSYFAKKFYCDKCGKKTWQEVENYGVIAEEYAKLVYPIIIKQLIILAVGSTIISIFPN